jgi:hypothetical protein
MQLTFVSEDNGLALTVTHLRSGSSAAGWYLETGQYP